jgi:hypothetical protein
MLKRLDAQGMNLNGATAGGRELVMFWSILNEKLGEH